jgi:hypothetical protein
MFLLICFQNVLSVRPEGFILNIEGLHAVTLPAGLHYTPFILELA